LDIETLQITD